MIYNSLILSRFHYGNILWGIAPGNLIKMQKKAVRAIMGRGYNAHSIQLLKKLKLLSLSDLHNMKLLTIYKQYIDKNLPTYLTKAIGTLDLSKDIKPPRTKIYENTLRFQLPAYLKTAPDYLLDLCHRVKYLCFKNNTKKYIIERYPAICVITGCRVCHFTYTTS